MKHLKYTCDRCGKRIINGKPCYNDNYAIKSTSALIRLWGINEPRSSQGQRIDLCNDCYEAFIGFLEGGVTDDQ